ncbi:hypothetical protein XA68_13099 [Ophiocordyceps unilateralis]|uniref:Uncharacterized protein n=1 Tax=Ophiocordyceps unilateralis TaxID=268505 RepID=A0A2A9PCW3_OPHUN|nr:hypothetical protein XA68_13099 [Ophiocordyceps unilateralis]
MPVLGFSHGRCSSKPKDLHIRKISFSGCSLSSGSSFSSSPANSIAYACSSSSSSTSLLPPSTSCSSRPPLEGHADPLAQHPTYSPPPRLHHRPLLDAAMFLGGADDDDVFHSRRPVDKELPRLPSSSVSDVDVSENRRPDEARDYFSVPLPTRPQFPPSRWSDSTIASMDLSDLASDSDLDDSDHVDQSVDSDSSDDVEEPLDSEVEDTIHVHHDASDAEDRHYHFQQPLDGHCSMPNFSYKRATALPKRPPIKTLDSLDEFVKRGGWKRRGIIFHNEEMTDSADLHL